MKKDIGITLNKILEKKRNKIELNEVIRKDDNDRRVMETNSISSFSYFNKKHILYRILNEARN